MAWTRQKQMYHSCLRWLNLHRTCGDYGLMSLVSSCNHMYTMAVTLNNLLKIAKLRKWLICVKYTTYVGALVHTRADGGKCPYIFIDLHQWPSTSNITIAILLYVINQQEQLPQVSGVSKTQYYNITFKLK